MDRLVAMRIDRGCLAAVLVCVLVAGCGRREYTGERRHAISGSVKADGQPIGMGVISFVPQGEGGRICGGPIRDGTYSVAEPMGATPGKYRVEIHWNKPTGKKIRNPMDRDEMIDEMMEGMPDRYHKSSELTAEVSAKQTKFDFDLKTK